MRQKAQHGKRWKARQGSAGRPRRHSRETPQGAAQLNSPQKPKPTACRGPPSAPPPWAPPTLMPRLRRSAAREPAKRRPRKPPRTPRRPARPPRAEGQGSVEWCGMDVPKAQSIRAPHREAAGPAERRRKAQYDSNHRKIPNPSHAAGAAPIPMPRHRRSPARKPVTPWMPQNTPNLRHTRNNRDPEEVT